MSLEGGADFGDGLEEAVGMEAFLEAPAEGGGEVIPPGLAELGVERGAPHDGEFLAPGREEDEQAGFLSLSLELLFDEKLMRFVHRIGDVAMADEKNDAARGAEFGRLDGLVNAVVLDRAEEVADFHVTSPRPHRRRRNFPRRC